MKASGNVALSGRKEAEKGRKGVRTILLSPSGNGFAALIPKSSSEGQNGPNSIRKAGGA